MKAFIPVLIGVLALFLILSSIADAQATSIYPDTRTLVRASESTPFANVGANDDVLWTTAETSVQSTDNSFPGTQTIAKGTQTAGTYPDCINVFPSENTRCTWQEADQSSITQLDPDTETINKGSGVSGAFPTDVTSDNGVARVYREANQAPAQTLAFDATTESVRTGTTDPHTFTHTPVVSAPRGAILTATHGTESTDCIVSVTYGGTTMTRVATAADTATEPGRSYIYFLGASIPTGAVTISIDIAAAGACSTTDDQFVAVTYSAGADTEVLTSATDAENQGNPTATLAYSSREALAIMAFYSGLGVIPLTSNCSGSSACTLVHDHDFGAFVGSVDRQSTRGATDQVMGYTSGNDDVALVYVAITQTDSAADYEITVTYDHTGPETCADTRRLTVNSWRTNANMENVDVQVVDSTETTWTTRFTVSATADGTTQTYDLTADEWDSGLPNYRFIGTTEAGDTLQGDFTVDWAVIRCIPPADYELEVKYSWTGVSTTGVSWRLFVEGQEGAVNPEQLDIRIYAADEIGLSAVVCSITSTTEAEYDCGLLTTDQLDGGTPDIQLVDLTQASDTTQSTVDLDTIRILRTFDQYQIEVQVDWLTTLNPNAPSWTLNVRWLRAGDSETITLQVLTWPSTYNTRLTLASATEILDTYAMLASEIDTDGDARIRFIETTNDATQTSLSVDELFILQEPIASGGYEQPPCDPNEAPDEERCLGATGVGMGLAGLGEMIVDNGIVITIGFIVIIGIAYGVIRGVQIRGE